MMGIRAYVLIETAMGRSREVSEALNGCPWVEHVERVAGPYDIVAIARGDGRCNLDDVVNDGLRPIDGVIRVVVCPVSSLFESAQAATAVATL